MNQFTNLKKYLHWIGVLQYEANSGRMITFALNCAYIIILVSYMVTTFWFFAFDASNFEEYTETLIFWSSVLQSIVCYLTSIWRRKNILHLFIELDAIIEKSKFEKIFYSNSLN